MRILRNLYEGYFKHPHSQNEFFKGTATAGLLILRVACEKCVKIQRGLGELNNARFS